MIEAGGILMLLAFLAIALVPVYVVFGVFGLVFQSIWAAILFVLKYLLPMGVLGLIVALICGKKHVFLLVDYIKIIGAFLGAGFLAMVIILNLPASPVLPEKEEVTSVEVSYNYDAATVQTITDENTLQTLCDGMQRVKYKRLLKELLDDENEDLELKVTFTCEDGSTIEYRLYSDKEMAVKKGGTLRYYRVAKDSAELPYDASQNAMYEAKRQQALVVWQPFLDELYNSIYYSKDDGYLNFRIPEEAPADFSIRFDLKGMDQYTGGKFDEVNFDIFQDLQKQQNWERGSWYCFPVSTICYSKMELSVYSEKLGTERYSLLKYLPAKNVYRKSKK